MTELQRILLTAGVTFVAAALGAIVAPFLKAFFDRDLESRKVLLARQTKILEKEVEIVTEIYAALRAIADELDSCKRHLVFSEDIRASLDARLEDVNNYIGRCALFMGNKSRHALHEISYHITLGLIYLSRASRESLPESERLEAKEKLRKAADFGIPTSFIEADRALRRIVRPLPPE